jgi:hypothetical protein
MISSYTKVVFKLTKFDQMYRLHYKNHYMFRQSYVVLESIYNLL